MSKKLYEESNIQAIASAIRFKNGLSSRYSVADMAGAVLSIKTDPVLESLTVSSNSTYVPGEGIDGFSQVVVNIPASSVDPVLESLTVSSNSTYVPGEGIDGFSQVVVNVPTGGGSSIYNEAFLAMAGSISGYVYDVDGLVSSIPFGRFGKVVYSQYSFVTSGNNPYILGVNFPSCENIGGAAFYYNNNLSEAIFPECLTINGGAFRKCEKLATISFPKCETITNNNMNVNGGAFRECFSLTSVLFPKCTRIDSCIFSSCNLLTEIHFPILETIATSAFYDLHGLTIVDIPRCKVIGSSAFQNYPYDDTSSRHNSVLSTVSFSMCEVIYSNAFHGNHALESVYLLSSSVVSLGTNVFTWTPITNSAYLGHFGSIFVPESLVDVYKSATNWSTISDRITAYIGP